MVTPDGPWGPYRVAKPGALIVARHAGFRLLPVAVRAKPAIRLTGRWDRQLVPLPFSRLTLLAGEPLTVAPMGPFGPCCPACSRPSTRLLPAPSAEQRRRAAPTADPLLVGGGCLVETGLPPVREPWSAGSG